MLVGSYSFAAELAPPSRRTEALGLYGLASAIPAILFVPAGPWMLAGVGPAATAILAALLALAGLAGLSALPARAADPGDGDHRRSLPDLRLAAWPAVALAIGAVATGVTITFLPVAHPELSPALVMVALLIGNLSSACARWASGRPIDRRGPTAAVTGGVMAAVFGMLCLSRTGGVAVIAGTAIVGCAFGILQSATLAQLLGRARPSEIDGAGALWNGAYDAGFGVGGLAFGGLATRLNYGASFTVTALGLTILACLIFWRFEARDGNK
jgi:predicted MFS family arabinose efflux permease